MARTRITITIPQELVESADRRAEQLERSRSWVLVEALRRYLAEPGRVRAGAVREPDAGSYLAGLGPHRLAQLEADLELTPEQRVKEAERTARVAELRAGPPQRDRILMFDRYEDYLAWKKGEEVRP